MVRATLKPWNASFPNRPCWTCGAAPTYFDRFGEPFYPATCLHEPAAESALFEWFDVPLSVTLTPAELKQARECGEKRIAAAERRGRQDRLSEYSVRSHRLGAIGERAYAKWLGVPWRCTMNGFGGAADVAGAQIRTVGRIDQRLVVHPNDPPKIPVVLMVAPPDRPRVTVRGWIRSGDARREEWIDDPGGKRWSFFVPQHALRDPAELRTHGA